MLVFKNPRSSLAACQQETLFLRTTFYSQNKAQTNHTRAPTNSSESCVLLKDADLVELERQYTNTQ